MACILNASPTTLDQRRGSTRLTVAACGAGSGLGVAAETSDLEVHMKVLAIGASARRDGNSNGLLKAAVEAASARGATVDVVYARDLKVQGCLGCDGCKRSVDATCVVKDDMQDLYARIAECDALVLATPVYFYDMNSWLKAIVDRLYALIDPNDKARIQTGKPFYVITTEEASDSLSGADIARTLTRALAWIGMEPRGELIAGNLLAAGDWRSRDDYISAAQALIGVAER